VNNKETVDDFFFHWICWCYLIKKWSRKWFLVNFLKMERHSRSSLHILISFSTPQNDLKKDYTSKSWWNVHVEKIRVFGSLLSILILTFWFQHMYNVLPIQTSFINLVNDGIFSKIVWISQSCFQSYTSLFSFQWWQSSILFHIIEELCLSQELVKKNKSCAQTSLFLYRLRNSNIFQLNVLANNLSRALYLSS